MKLHEYLEDHGILMAGMVVVFLLQGVPVYYTPLAPRSSVGGSDSAAVASCHLTLPTHARGGN